jgi:hypothetical protein
MACGRELIALDEQWADHQTAKKKIPDNKRGIYADDCPT